MCYPNFFFSYHHSNHLLHHHHGQQDMFIFTTSTIKNNNIIWYDDIACSAWIKTKICSFYNFYEYTTCNTSIVFLKDLFWTNRENFFLFLKLFLCKKWFGKESNINNNEGNISTWNTQALAFTSNIKSDTICFVYGCVVWYKILKF